MSFEQFQRLDYEKSALVSRGIKMEKCLFGEDEIEVPEILLEDVSKHNFYDIYLKYFLYCIYIFKILN